MTMKNMTKGNNDTCVSILCHSRAMTRESRNEDVNSDWIFGSSPNMTGGNNNSNMTEGNNALSIISQSGHIPPSVTLGRSETKTRGSRSHECRIETGRSMVEMLGVLAIIGVLSIGGIMGYSYGMDKYRANETMQAVTLRGIDVLAQFDRTGDANLNEWKNQKTIYPITLEEGTIGIQVDEVPERVCDMIAEGMTYVAKGTKVNGSYAVDGTNTCDGDKNTLVFYFDEGKSEKVCEIVGYDGCHSCDDLKAVPTNRKLECNICENRKEEGDFCVLKECPTGYNRDAIGGCFRCEDKQPFFSYGDCSDCEGYLLTDFGFCYFNEECPNNYLRTLNTTCASCETEDILFSTLEECTKCPTRIPMDVGDGKTLMCISQKMMEQIENAEEPALCPEGEVAIVYESGGFSISCVPCDYPGVLPEAACSSCPNRTFVEGSDTLCVLKCPADKPLQNYTGACYACDDPTPVELGVIEMYKCKEVCGELRYEGDAFYCLLKTSN